MGTITTTSIITKAQALMLDAAGERWSQSDCLKWLNEGQRALLTYKPNAYVKRVTVDLAAGTTQSLPADAIALINIPANASGLSVGVADLRVMDAKAPRWRQTDPEVEVRHFMYSTLDPKRYEVYPPNTGTGQVEMVHSALPPDATANGTISVDDIYEAPLVDYIAYRGYSQDSEYTPDQSRADKHLNAFIAALTGKAKGEAATTPNNQQPK